MGGMSTKQILEQVAAEEGVPLSYLMKTARVESNFNPAAVNKGSDAVGLFQLTPIARQELGITREMSFDPLENARAAARIYKTNIRALTKDNLPVSDTTAYLLHQQGSTGGRRVLRSALSGEPLPASTRRNMTFNVTEDARGSVFGSDLAPTDDLTAAAQFMQYANARMEGVQFQPLPIRPREPNLFEPDNFVEAVPDFSVSREAPPEDDNTLPPYYIAAPGGPSRTEAQSRGRSRRRQAVDGASSIFGFGPNSSDLPDIFGAGPMTSITPEAAQQRQAAFFETGGYLDRLFGERQVTLEDPEYRWVNVGHEGADPLRMAITAQGLRESSTRTAAEGRTLSLSTADLIDPLGNVVGQRTRPRNSARSLPNP